MPLMPWVSCSELQTQSNLSEIVKKLPVYLQNKWREVVRHLKIHEHRRPDLQEVVEYVEEAAVVASDPIYGSQSQRSERNPPSTRAAYATSTSLSCPVCEEEGHGVMSCEKYVALQQEDRLQTAIQLKLCFVCLRDGHITRDCTSKTRCETEDCGRMHATMLHAANWSKLQEQGRRRREQAASGRSEKAPAGEPSTTGSVYHAQRKKYHHRDANASRGMKIALPLVPVRVYSPENKRSHLTYALLDNGSSVTMCHERLLQILGLQGQAKTMSLTTLDKEYSRTPTRAISLEVNDPDGEGSLRLGQVYTRSSLPIDPRNMVTMDKTTRWPHLKGLPLHHAPADEVMLLIGQDYPDALVPLATVPGGKGEPYAIKTRLGWMVNGPVTASETQIEQQVFFTQREWYEQLDQKLERFRELESSGLYEDDRAMPARDKLITARWEETVGYSDGHCALPILFRFEEPGTQDNKRMAETCLNSVSEKVEEDARSSEEFMEGTRDPYGGMSPEDPEDKVIRLLRQSLEELERLHDQDKKTVQEKLDRVKQLLTQKIEEFETQQTMDRDEIENYSHWIRLVRTVACFKSLAG